LATVIEHGGDIHPTAMKNGRAPLLFVKSLDSLKILLNAGAKIDKEGDSLLSEYTKLDDDILHYLVEEYKVNLNALDKYGNSYIQKLISSGDIKSLAYIIKHNADVNLLSVGEISPLLQSIRLNNEDAVRLLINADANIDYAPDNTPILFDAIKNKNHTIVDMLIDAGVNLDVFDNDGNSPDLDSDSTPSFSR
jgi:ankyrin repeat protein